MAEVGPESMKSPFLDLPSNFTAKDAGTTVRPLALKPDSSLIAVSFSARYSITLFLILEKAPNTGVCFFPK